MHHSWTLPLLLLLLLLSVLAVSCSTQQRVPAGQVKNIVYGDVHVHLQALSAEYETAKNWQALQNNAKQFFTTNPLQRALLISPSYQVREETADRFAMDAQTAQIIEEESPGRLAGACGVNLAWTDASAVVQKCLQRKTSAGRRSMIGIKVHMRTLPEDFETTDTLIDRKYFEEVSQKKFKPSKYYQRLEEVLKTNRGLIRFVLIHNYFYGLQDLWKSRPYSPKNMTADKREMDALFTLVKEFPEIQFIGAHLLESREIIRYIGKKLDAAGLDNFWIDTSHRLIEHGPAEFFLFFAYLGTDRVLFGSDSVIEHGRLQDRVSLEARYLKRGIQMLEEQLERKPKLEALLDNAGYQHGWVPDIEPFVEKSSYEYLWMKFTKDNLKNFFDTMEAR